jgi:hypothetical protein
MKFEFHWTTTALEIPHVCDIYINTTSAVAILMTIVVIKLARMGNTARATRKQSKKQVQNEGTELSW